MSEVIPVVLSYDRIKRMANFMGWELSRNQNSLHSMGMGIMEIPNGYFKIHPNDFRPEQSWDLCMRIMRRISVKYNLAIELYESKVSCPELAIVDPLSFVSVVDVDAPNLIQCMARVLSNIIEFKANEETTPKVDKFKKIYEKGYILKVKSWENDGDHNRIKEIHYQEHELEILEAHIRVLSKLFQPHHDSELGISNDYEVSLETYIDRINDFWSEDPYFANQLIRSNQERVNTIESIGVSLMGWPVDDYSMRVAEKYEVFKIQEDIFVEILDL